MGTHYIETFRLREFEIEKFYCKTLGVGSLDIFTLRQRMFKLNSSKFKSEIWFRNLLSQFNYNGVVFTNYPILNRFFADFYFKDLHLVVEIDGSSHNESKDYDYRRDELFLKRGLKTVRLKSFDNSSAIKLFQDITMMDRFNVADMQPVPRKRKKNRKPLGKDKAPMKPIKVFKKVVMTDSWNKMMIDGLRKS